MGGGMDGGSRAELKTLSDQTTAEKRANIWLQLAIGYYQNKQYATALDEIKKALGANPEFADAYGMRALIYTAMGNQLALADENYQKALRLAPADPEISNNYGSFLCQNGRAQQAMAYFDVALKDPRYRSPINALLNAGNCSLKLNKPDLAERYLLDALRLDAELPAISAGLARVYYERRDYTRAGFFMSRLKANAKLETLPADLLWLGIRIERKLGDNAAETSMATQLRRRHAGSPEYAAYTRGAFDE
ncbi:type IV pilus biogenesis/stability protein PilW [Massilia glaciei]|uniref:Type IV pilus biogenesis/stability protein PilW n=2 Tax=Massilia glaciei TaxID=1524097 RepID=A0A2U2HPB9_9BURK|nr:type IV pilus biogenesis/stability protein PilW [Massilia glaciei]